MTYEELMKVGMSRRLSVEPGGELERVGSHTQLVLDELCSGILRGRRFVSFRSGVVNSFTKRLRVYQLVSSTVAHSSHLERRRWLKRMDLVAVHDSSECLSSMLHRGWVERPVSSQGAYSKSSEDEGERQHLWVSRKESEMDL